MDHGLSDVTVSVTMHNTSLLLCAALGDIAVVFSVTSGIQTQTTYGITSPISMAGPRPEVGALRSSNWVLFIQV